MIPRSLVTGAVLLPFVAAGALAQPDLTEVRFGTNWLPQAEHGGFYQALADGSYAECGLEVKIIPGGPQVNNRALLMAGRLDFYMGGDLLLAFNAVAEGVPVVTIAAAFQKHPQVFLSHPGVADSWDELKDLTLLIAANGYVSYYQWMIAEHGFSPERRAPYNFNPAPFIADPQTGMQGFVSSEPYTVANTPGGFEPNVFLIADQGYSTYSTTIETMAQTIETRPEVVQCFVDGSIRGWYHYIYGDNAAANQMILEANPDMSQDRIDYAISAMIDYGIVDSGDALDLGVGAMTEAKVKDFFDKMVAAGVIPSDIDWRAAFTSEFVNKGVGMELRPKG